MSTLVSSHYINTQEYWWKKDVSILPDVCVIYSRKKTNLLKLSTVNLIGKSDAYLRWLLTGGFGKLVLVRYPSRRVVLLTQFCRLWILIIVTAEKSPSLRV